MTAASSSSSSSSRPTGTASSITASPPDTIGVQSWPWALLSASVNGPIDSPPSAAWIRSEPPGGIRYRVKPKLRDSAPGDVTRSRHTANRPSLVTSQAPWPVGVTSTANGSANGMGRPAGSASIRLAERTTAGVASTGTSPSGRRPSRTGAAASPGMSGPPGWPWTPAAARTSAVPSAQAASAARPRPRITGSPAGTP